MPPANTPDRTSPRTLTTRTRPDTPPRAATPPSLSYLSSPVLDLASTLHTQAAEDADEANVSFLRDSLESLDQSATSSNENSQTSRRHLSYINPSRDPRRSSSQQVQHADGQSGPLDDLSRQERLRRVLARLNRIHDPSGSSTSAYSNRTPSPRRQSLYDWAPATEERVQEATNDLDQILAELRRQQPDTHPDILRVLSQSQLESARWRERDASTRNLAISEMTDADRRERLREHARRRRDPEWTSVRNRAFQRTRQESSPSATAATERMLRYVMERERSGMSEEEERARGAGWFNEGSSSRPRTEENESTASSSIRDSGYHSATRASGIRTDPARRYTAEPSRPRSPRISTPPVLSLPSSSNSPPQFLENALKYLNDLRSCFRYEDALSVAIDHGLALKEFFADKHDDFIMDLDEIDAPPESSWLRRGTAFEGHQHATGGNAGVLLSRPTPPAHSVEQINPNYRSQENPPGFDHPPGSTRVTTFDASRPWLSHQPIPPHAVSSASTKPVDPNHDHWPVRVVIHAVDDERKTLQGTMEAYDVPQHPAGVSILNPSSRPKAGKKHAPITTYLEGHIIDLRTHSFLTPCANDPKRAVPYATAPWNATPYTALPDAITFPSANAHIDAVNWRKLPPFSSLRDDDEAARVFLSRARMNEMNEAYVFMRWKERCFVHGKDDKCTAPLGDRASDQDRGHGLTISGFYYVSLRRSDGMVEGLYFDPTSTPYQHLRLRGHATGWPSLGFR